MKKTVAFLLAAAILLGFCACAIPEEPVLPDSGRDTETDNTHRDPGLPDDTYGGRSFRIMASSLVSKNDRARDVVFFEDVSANTINEAVHDRNVYIEETYQVKITAVWQKTEEMAYEIEKSVLDGLPVCDVMEGALGQYAQLVNRQELLDLRKIPYLDLTQDWWSQRCAEGLSVAGALYFCTGDIMITDKMGTWSICFNRDLVKSYSLEKPYDLVDAGTWTYDKMLEMATIVSTASSFERNDYFGPTWGILSETGNTYMLWKGSGTSLIVKDPETDRPKMAELSESAYNAMMKVAALQFAGNVTLLASTITGVDSQFFDGTIRIFEDGKGLFFVGSMTMVEWMRQSDVDFGVLPMPKYDTVQKEYYSSLSPTHYYALAIPSNCADVTFAGIITQALACESTDTLGEAYYDKTLRYKGLRRAEDERMLDLVFRNRLYDLTQVFPWADSLIVEIANAKTERRVSQLKSTYDTYRTSIDRRIDEFLTAHGLD